MQPENSSTQYYKNAIRSVKIFLVFVLLLAISSTFMKNYIHNTLEQKKQAELIQLQLLKHQEMELKEQEMQKDNENAEVQNQQPYEVQYNQPPMPPSEYQNAESTMPPPQYQYNQPPMDVNSNRVFERVPSEEFEQMPEKRP